MQSVPLVEAHETTNAIVNSCRLSAAETLAEADTNYKTEAEIKAETYDLSSRVTVSNSGPLFQPRSPPHSRSQLTLASAAAFFREPDQ
jgi:hypothetical protein